MSIACASALSTEERAAAAAADAASRARRDLGGREPDLALLFVSRHHAPALPALLDAVARGLGARHLLGCVGQGVIAGEREVEDEPALGLWAASLPGVEIRPARIRAEETPEGLAFSGLPPVSEDGGTLLLLGDPFTFPAVELLGRLEEDHPRLQVLGGMASGAMSPGESRLFLDGEILEDGAAAVLLGSSLRVRPVVSQGCRPFGKHLVITRAEGNVIHELGGRPAMERLHEQVGMLSGDERNLLRRGLHLGRAIDPTRRAFGRGDFLIRNVVGADPDQGSLAIADAVRAGQTVQFHLRDARTASEDLELLLRQARADSAKPAGALLFSCNGRGSHLFERPDHDASAVRTELGPIPLAGFFAAGELGPVGGRNFLHGFTASLALIEET